jgi:NAD(P)H-dependent FMN reductase
VDFTPSEEARWRRRAVTRSARLSDAVLRSARNAATPGRPAFENEVVQRWTAAIAQSDGFVFVTPEYNYGPAAVLKNASTGFIRGGIARRLAS